MRSYFSNPKFLDAKNTHSHSPQPKTRHLEFNTENITTDKPTQGLSNANFDLRSSNSTKTKAFEQEIERRYQLSFSNQTYVFPRRHNHNAESDNSFESLLDISGYDLHSQNFKHSRFSETQGDSYCEEEVHTRQTTNKSVTQQIHTLRKSYTELRRNNDNGEHVGNKNMVREDYFKIENILDGVAGNKYQKRPLKMGTSKSQKNIHRRNLRQNNMLKSQTDNSNNSHETELQFERLLDMNKSPKVINLNVNVNMNINYNKSKDAKGNQEFPVGPLLSADCFVNCNFLSNPSNLKDFNINIIKGADQKNSESKTFETESSSKSHKNATSSAMLAADKILKNFKNPHPTMSTDTDKLKKAHHISKPKENKENIASRNTLLTSPRLLEEATSPKGANKSQKKFETVRKIQQNTLKHTSPCYSSLQTMVLGSQTSRASDIHNHHSDSKNKLQSPKLNNFLCLSTTNLKSLGEKVAHKNDYTLRSSHNLHSEGSGITLGTKVSTSKSTTKLDRDPKARVTEKQTSVEKVLKANKSKIDMAKLKLNLGGIGKKMGALSDRMRVSSDRNEKANKSHAEYFQCKKIGSKMTAICFDL